MENTALKPLPKIEDDCYDWYERHAAKLVAAKTANHELIFAGDSITHFFEGHPCDAARSGEVWHKSFGKRKALNLGFGYDRTQNLLYRFDNGELDGQTPKLFILCIGTNNLTATAKALGNSPEETLEGIKAVCACIHKHTPSTHIIVQALFPRDKAGSELRKKVEALNTLLKKSVGSWGNCEFLDFGYRYLDAKGEIPLSLMADLTHPTEEGYAIWADSIEPIVERFLGK